MGRIQRKLFFSVLIFIAGFASACYVMAPENTIATDGQTAAGHSNVRASLKASAQQLCSQQLIDSLDSNINKLCSLVEEKAISAKDAIQTAMKERQNNAAGAATEN